MATRDYANAIIQIIVNELLNGVSVFGKILTRSDTGKDIKHISSILPGEEHLTLILDDRPQIWEQFKHHVVPIYPYKFFINLDNQMYTINQEENEENLDPLLQSLPEGTKERPDDLKRNNSSPIVCSPLDNHLRSMYHVLASVHKHFFTNLKASENLNIQYHLKWRRMKVLSGVHLIFSGVFPLGTEPKMHTLWKNAEYYGAKCHEQFNDNITHLVAAREGTDKVLEALRRENVYIITPNWLYDSLAHWIRLPENDFVLIVKSSIVLNK
jgi:hypothetical protein